MNKYECKECPRECTLTTEDDDHPDMCAFSLDQVTWIKIARNDIKNDNEVQP